jgi:predicted ATPase
VAIETLTPRHFEVLMRTPGYTREFHNLSDVGFGNSQILPILVEGYLGSALTMVIEQPEIHLHPAAQLKLGDFFHDLVKAGKQVIVETHSEHLLLRLQTLVAKGELPAEDVQVLYVEREESRSNVRVLEITRMGSFQNWPKGFFGEKHAELSELVEAAAKVSGG